MCRIVRGKSPGARLVHDFLLSLWRQGDQSDADPDWQGGIANVFLDLLSFAIRGAEAVPAAPKGTKERILALIEARLTDPAGNALCLYQAGETRRFPPWRLP